jgi:hypothetical protein
MSVHFVKLAHGPYLAAGFRVFRETSGHPMNESCALLPKAHESHEVIPDDANKVMRTSNSQCIIVTDSAAKPVSSNAWSQVSCHTTKSGSSEYLFPDSASPPYSRLGLKLDMDDRTLVMAMVNGIGVILTNDEKWSHLSDLRREGLIDLM